MPHERVHLKPPVEVLAFDSGARVVVSVFPETERLRIIIGDETDHEGEPRCRATLTLVDAERVVDGLSQAIVLLRQKLSEKAQENLINLVSPPGT